MARVNRPYGKDDPTRFIDHALTGGDGPSKEIVDTKVDRPDQVIKSAYALDNVRVAYYEPTSVKDLTGWAGGIENIKHSLTGGDAVEAEGVGAAGKVKHPIFPNH